MKSVGIADLKAHLSEHLRSVRNGESLIVLDRHTPVARVVPFAAGSAAPAVRRSRRGYPSLAKVPLPPALKVSVDVVDLLLEERQGER
ncbi:MAG: type II toxin-antitoxin system prevent-host-death family antitoxin [Deltaproteobacteria bacterium]|jgi:prevent-host-death family protein|nr:type II toxin-antitoxin system prevent-host-death family antitoxin [Deltaproteobacteria bacterium]